MYNKKKPANAKKNEARPILTNDEIEEIREAFNLFDTDGTGKIDPKELKAAMQSLNFDTKNPTIFQMIAELESFGRPIDFDEFLEEIQSKLGDRETKAGIEKIFDLFVEEKNANSISLNHLMKVSKELGETMTKDELLEMLERAASNGREITREDFYNIMTKKIF